MSGEGQEVAGAVMTPPEKPDACQSHRQTCHRNRRRHVGRMPDRADYLARQLLARASAFEADAADEAALLTARERLVTKVLASEAGITDGATVRLVASALPDEASRRLGADRAAHEFAGFLRERLGPRLEMK